MGQSHNENMLHRVHSTAQSNKDEKCWGMVLFSGQLKIMTLPWSWPLPITLLGEEGLYRSFGLSIIEGKVLGHFSFRLVDKIQEAPQYLLFRKISWYLLLLNLFSQSSEEQRCSRPAKPSLPPCPHQKKSWKTCIWIFCEIEGTCFSFNKRSYVKKPRHYIVCIRNLNIEHKSTM